MTQTFDCRDAFARSLEQLAENDSRIIALINDSLSSTKLGRFQRRFPSRLLNIGIAEQNMVGIGAGLANGGKIPFVCGASCFLTARAMEQVKVDLAYARSNVKLCGMSSGMAYGALGPTHHSIEDLAWTRAIADLTVIVPADPSETEQAVRFAAAMEGPVFLRLSRIPVPAVHPEGYRIEFGHAVQLRDGADVTIIANGVMVSRALAAAEALAEAGVSARVLNLSTLRPLDDAAIVEAAGRTGAIVTIEEHSVHGGLGSAVAEITSTRNPVPMRILGVPDVFAPTGPAEWLLTHFRLTPEAIRDAANEVIALKRRP